MARLTPAIPAMARKPPASPKRARFAAALANHLNLGTGNQGRKWSYEKFAEAVPSSRIESNTVSPRTISNWCKGLSLPQEIDPVLQALFGDGERHAADRANLVALFRAARAEQTDAALRRAKLSAVGAIWIVQGDRLAMDRSARPTDARAAANKLQQQMQAEIQDLAAKLAEATKRPSNSRLLGHLSTTAALFSGLLKCEPSQFPKQLGRAYRLSLQLGECLEIDKRNQGDHVDTPLAPDIRSQLQVLVQMAAPWLRGFPSIRTLDEHARKALVQTDLFEPTRDFIRNSLEKEAISAEDADDVVASLPTDYDPRNSTTRPGFQGRKAANVAVGDAINLLLTVARRVAASQAGIVASLPAERKLVQRLTDTIIGAETPVKAFADTMSVDLRHALLTLADEARQLRASGSRAPVAALDPSIPDDVEGQARQLILDGRPPPNEWSPLIRRLDLSFSGTLSLSLLAG